MSYCFSQFLGYAREVSFFRYATRMTARRSHSKPFCYLSRLLRPVSLPAIMYPLSADWDITNLLSKDSRRRARKIILKLREEMVAQITSTLMKTVTSMPRCIRTTRDSSLWYYDQSQSQQVPVWEVEEFHSSILQQTPDDRYSMRYVHTPYRTVTGFTVGTKY